MRDKPIILGRYSPSQKAAIKREQCQTGLSIAEREQARPTGQWHSGKPTRTRTLPCRGDHRLTQIERIYSKMTKKTMKSLLVSTLLLIFAASNQISDPKSLLTRGSVFCGHLTSLVENSHAPQGADYILGGNRVGYWKQPKVSANLNLTARSAAVLLLSNVKSN